MSTTRSTIQETKEALAARLKARQEADAAVQAARVIVPKPPNPPSARLIAKSLTTEMPLKQGPASDD